MTLRAALAQLATVPPKAFTRERNALAVRLREAGYAKDAARVKARRAPTLPVWIANRLAIEHPDDVRALIAAADRVKAAQLGRGGKAGTLAAATAGHRAALDRLLDQGRAMLNQAGGGATHDKLLRVQNTLTAAAVDAAARKALQAGALERELTAPGFDVFGGDLPAGARGRAGAKPAAAEAKASSRDVVRAEARAEEPARRRDEALVPREERRRQRDRADRRGEEHRRQREQARAQRTERIAQARASLGNALQVASSAQERAESTKQTLKARLDQVPAARQALRETEAEMRRAARAVTQAQSAVRAAEAEATR